MRYVFLKVRLALLRLVLYGSAVQILPERGKKVNYFVPHVIIRFYFHFNDDDLKRWPNVKSIKPDLQVRLLADESASICEDAYRIWELATAMEMIIPYESIKEVKSANTRAEIIQVAKFLSALLVFHFVCLYFKRKADRNIPGLAQK